MSSIQQLYYKSSQNDEASVANFAKGNAHDRLQDTKLNLLENRLNGLRDYFREHENEFPQHEIHRNIGELFFSALPIDDLGARLLNGDYIGKEDHPSFYAKMKKFYDQKYIKERTFNNCEKTGEPHEVITPTSIVSTTDSENYLKLGRITALNDWHIILRTQITADDITNERVIFEAEQIKLQIKKVNGINRFVFSVFGTPHTGNFVVAEGWYYLKMFFNGYRYIFDYSIAEEDGYITDAAEVNSEQVYPFDVYLKDGIFELTQTYIVNEAEYKYAGIPETYTRKYNFFCTEDEYQASLDAEGVCAKFVFADDYIRLPKVNLIEGTSDLDELGDLGALGDIADDTGFQTGKYYLYICVGNMVRVESEVKLTETLLNPYQMFDVRTSAKEIQNASWLLQTRGWNSGDVYESAWEELTSRYRDNDQRVKSVDDNYSDDDFVINRDEKTFRLPQTQYSVHELLEHVQNAYGEYWLYSDGFVRMTGRNAGAHQNFITLPYPNMLDNNYEVTLTQEGNDGSAQYAVYNKGKLGFNIRVTRYATWRQYNGANNDNLCDVDKGYTRPLRFEVTGYVDNKTKTYYYVGAIVRNAGVVNASQVLNEIAKFRRDVRVIKTYHNGPSWYRIWSDGWCEQGSTGYNTNQTTLHNFLIPFADTNYTWMGTSTSGTWISKISVINKTKTNVTLWTSDDDSFNPTNFMWEAKGYIDLTTINFESESIYGISNAQMDGIQRKLDALFEQMKEYMAVNSQLKVSESIPKNPDEDTLYVITDDDSSTTWENKDISELHQSINSLKTQMDLLRTQIKNNNTDNIVIPISEDENLEGTPVDPVEVTDDNGNTETHSLEEVLNGQN